MRKIVSVLAAAAVCFSGMEFTNKKACAISEQGTDKIKIMAIGDSITDGYGVAGSYRKYLYNELTKKGYSVDMVGSKGNSFMAEFTDSETGESFTYDDDNTGYSGYAIKEYPGRNGILETLKSTDCLAKCEPDIVILQIGTNDVIDNHDMDNAPKRLQELIEYIMDSIPESSTLLVTTIPDVDPNRSGVYDWFGNYRHSADWQTNYPDDVAEENIHKTLLTYNANVTSVVQKMRSVRILSSWDMENEKQTPDESSLKGPQLRNADVSSVITDVKTQLMDGVHPNNKGYKLMGEYWAELIDSYLKNSLTVQQPDESKYNVSDLVKLQKFILGAFADANSDITLEKYDINKDEAIDVFDVVGLRKILIKDSSV
ncbi:SGNH/GDSL hydrolase family protein [Ruminococcus flavefaciens]|uniref:SGNH/GDSL hydrolase family protein n=1 Tax=Ruminococcus flavefaciens TaxID=1265 RepID=UPI000490E69F|nr:SGNH/GDSL hydrolase family protein [Ruminococcus flavefaciens]